MGTFMTLLQCQLAKSNRKSDLARNNQVVHHVNKIILIIMLGSLQYRKDNSALYGDVADESFAPPFEPWTGKCESEISCRISHARRHCST